MSSFNQEPVISKVEGLNPRSRRITTTVKVVSKNPVREVTSRTDNSTHRVTEALVGDETGTVLLTLWDDSIEKAAEGSIYQITNGYVTLFKGSMRLNLGRYGTMEASEAKIDTVKTDNNLSDKQYEEERRFGGGGYRRPMGRGRY